MFKKTRDFVKKHQAPIGVACIATGIYFVGRGHGRRIATHSIEMNNHYTAMDSLEHLTLLEFIDFKGLKDEFTTFYVEMNRENPLVLV